MGSGASSQPVTPRDRSNTGNDGSITARESRRKTSRPPSRSQTNPYAGSGRAYVNYGGGAIGNRSDSQAHQHYSSGTYARLNPNSSNTSSGAVSRHTTAQSSGGHVTTQQGAASRSNSQPPQEHRRMHYGTRSAVTREDEIVLAVKDVMTSKEWVDQFQTFLYHNSTIFEDTEDNKLSYTETHNSYKMMIEGLLDGVLRDMNASEEDLLTALAVCEPNDDPAGHAAVWILQVLLASEDFQSFKTLMIQCNRDSDGTLWKMLAPGSEERGVSLSSEIVSASTAQTDIPSRQSPATSRQHSDREYQGTYHDRELQEVIDVTREQARWHENMVDELETEQIRLAIQMSVSDFYRTQMQRLEKIASEVHNEEVALMTKRKALMLQKGAAKDAEQCSPAAILESQRLDLTQKHLEARREVLTEEWDRFGQLASVVDQAKGKSHGSIETMQKSQDAMKDMAGKYDQTTMQQASEHSHEMKRLEVYSQSIHRIKTCLDGAAVHSSTHEILTALEGFAGNETKALCLLLESNGNAPKDVEARLSTIISGTGISLADGVAMLVAAEYNATSLRNAMDDLEAKKDLVHHEKELLTAEAERIRAAAAMIESERREIECEKERLERMNEDLHRSNARDRENVEAEIRKLNAEAEKVRLESQALQVERSQLEALKKEAQLAKAKEEQLKRERELARLRDEERRIAEESEQELKRQKDTERQREEERRREEEKLQEDKQKAKEMLVEEERQRKEEATKEAERRKSERQAASMKQEQNQEQESLAIVKEGAAHNTDDTSADDNSFKEQGMQIGGEFTRVQPSDSANACSVKTISVESVSGSGGHNDVESGFKRTQRKNTLLLATGAKTIDHDGDENEEVGANFASVSRPRSGRRQVGRPRGAPSSGGDGGVSKGGEMWSRRKLVEEETTTESGSESEDDDEDNALRSGQFTKGPRNVFQKKGTPRLASAPLTSESSSGEEEYSDCDIVGESFDKERVPGMRGHTKKDLRVDEVGDDEVDQSSLSQV